MLRPQLWLSIPFKHPREGRGAIALVLRMQAIFALHLRLHDRHGARRAYAAFVMRLAHGRQAVGFVGRASSPIDVEVSDLAQRQAEVCVERVEQLLAKDGIGGHENRGPAIRVEHNAVHTS